MSIERVGQDLIPQNLNKCTYSLTRNRFHRQYWKRCIDCFPSAKEGACLNCISVCHAGHRIEDVLHVSDFFCDCGARGKNGNSSAHSNVRNSCCQLVDKVQLPSPRPDELPFLKMKSFSMNNLRTPSRTLAGRPDVCITRPVNNSAETAYEGPDVFITQSDNKTTDAFGSSPTFSESEFPSLT